MGLVGDDQDVVAGGEHGVPALLLFELELLQRRADHLAAGRLQALAQRLDAVGLMHRAHQRLSRHEVAVELVVQVGAVDLHHDRGVEARPSTQDAGQEDHGQALARALGVPDHADALVAAGLHSRQRLLDGEAHGEVLVVFGALLGDAVVDHLVDDVVAHVVQQAVFGEEALDQRLHAAGGVGLHRHAVDGLPGREPLEAGRVHAVQCGVAIGDDAEPVEGEELRDVHRVVADLVMRAGHVGILVPGVLQLEEHQRQPVDVDHQVGPAGVARIARTAALHRELVDHQEVVQLRPLEVEEVEMLVALLLARKPFGSFVSRTFVDLMT